MRNVTVFLLFSVFAALTYAEDESKVIRVDKSKFSDVYPAVWFSPSTGEITPLTEKSEVPPDKKYEIWIEPDDPEFGYNPDKKPKGVGFALIGKGASAFSEPEIPKSPKLKLKITKLMKEAQGPEQFVFFCKAKTCTCLIMVTNIDKEKGVIEFKWRFLKKDE